jgi:hypothetical protein
MRLYLPHKHSQSWVAPKIRAQNNPSRSGLKVRQLMVSGLVTSQWLQLRIFSGEAKEMWIESKSAIKFARSYGEDLKIASSSCD